MAILSVKVSTLETLDLSKALLHIDSGHVTLPREAFGDSGKHTIDITRLHDSGWLQ